MIETKTNIQNIKLVDFRLAMQAQGGKCVFSQNGTNALKKQHGKLWRKASDAKLGLRTRHKVLCFSM